METEVEEKNERDSHLIDAINRMNYDTFRILATKLLKSMGLEIISSDFEDDYGLIVAKVTEVVKDAAYPQYLIRVERKKEFTTPEELQDFFSAKRRKDMGTIYISTADFTEDAIRYAEEFEIDIVDDNQLAALLRKFDLLPDVMIYRDKEILKREKGRFLPSINELENILEQANRAFTRGHHREALRYFTKATSLKPNYDTAWYMTGVILNNIERYEDALEAFLVALDINSEDENIWYNMGLSLFSLGRYDEEIECYNRAILLKRDFLNAWNNKGTSLLQLERAEEAIDCFNEILKLNPRFDKALNNKGIALKKLKKAEEALDYFTKAIKINPTLVEAWLNKGIVLLDAKQYKDAYHCFEAVLRMDKGNVQAMYSKARTLESIGQYSLAIDLYDSIIIQDPKFKAAKRRKKKAEKNLELKGDSTLDREFFRIDAEKVGDYLAAIQEKQKERILVEKKVMAGEAVEPEATLPAPSLESKPPKETTPKTKKTVSHLERKKLIDMKKELEKKAKEMAHMEAQLREKYELIKKEGQDVKSLKSNMEKSREEIEKEKLKVNEITKELEEKVNNIAQAEEKIKEANEQIKEDWVAIEREKKKLKSTAEDIKKEEGDFKKEHEVIKQKLTESEFREKNIKEAEVTFSKEKEALGKEKEILESERQRIIEERAKLEAMEISIKSKEEDVRERSGEMQKKIEEISTREDELEKMALELKSTQDDLEVQTKIIKDKERSISEDIKLQKGDALAKEEAESIEEFLKSVTETSDEEETETKEDSLPSAITEQTESMAEKGLEIDTRAGPQMTKPTHIISIEEWTGEDFPYEESGLLKEISAMYGLGHLGKAQELIENALQKGYESKLLWLLKGNILYYQKQLEEALQCYISALRFDQRDPITLTNLMSINLKMGRYEEAYGWCQKVIDLSSMDERFVLKKAFLKVKLGQVDEALSTIEKALEVNDNLEDFWVFKGIILHILNRDEEAESCFEKGLNISSNHAIAWNNKAVILYNAGKYDEALECFNKAYEIIPFEKIKANKNACDEKIDSGEGPEGLIQTVEDLAKVSMEGAKEEGKTDEEGVSLYMCPSCGAFVSVDAEKCEKCGYDFTEEESGPIEEGGEQESEEEHKETKNEIIEKFIKISGVGHSKAEALYNAGYRSYDSLKKTSPSDMTKVEGISQSLAKKIKSQLRGKKFKD